MPQLYAPDCHIENCNAGYDGNQCGCRSAYTIDGHPTNTRHKGFTIDEFQRLDFGRIPIAEMLVQTMMPDSASELAQGVGFGDIESLTNPSSTLQNEGEASLSEQAPEIDPSNPTHPVIEIGGCTYVGDDMKVPISAADTEIIIFEPNQAYSAKICISSPIDKPGRVYALNMTMWPDEWERVSQLSTDSGLSPVYDACNPAYISHGWGDIGTFKTSMTIMSGTFFSGANCWQPVHYGDYFYSVVPWHDYSLAIEEMVVTKNSVFANDQTLLLPEENYYYSADYPGWLEIWAYWIAEEDIRRGKWTAVDGKCVVIDQGQSFLTPPPSPTDMAGNPIYDDNGYDASTGQYFSDDPVCQNWFISEIMSRNLEADLNEDCTLRPKESMGENFFAVNHNLCPMGFTEGIDCYCNCPPIAEDMQNPRMICPRPNKNNLVQRIVGYVNPAAFNAYYGRSDVQIRYAPYVP